MPRWQENVILGTALLWQIKSPSGPVYAHPAVNTASALARYPHETTRNHINATPSLHTGAQGHHAEAVIIRPSANVHFAVDAVANTIGPDSALLAGGQEYVFPLHPAVNTLTFLDAQSGSNIVRVRWVVMR